MKPLDELTAHCIRCGFCLESCPTFAETGEETESPRGRIYLARSADEGKLEWSQIRPHIDRCLGCRACETACPSGVEYGQIVEQARAAIEAAEPHRTKGFLIDSLSSPGWVRLQLALSRLLPGSRIPSLLSRLLSCESPEVDKPSVSAGDPYPELDTSGLPEIRGEVYLLEGCVMRVLFPGVHAATRRLLRRVGYTVRETSQGCCGSLHLHAGLLDKARKRGARLIESLEGDLPVVVNSAGCGSTMKGYGDLLGDAGEAFAGRVTDISEFLLRERLADVLRASRGLSLRATYHDACHLAHGQGVRTPPRTLLESVPGLELVALPESDMCCGSAGTYNLTQPKMARALLERKWRNIESTGADMVIMGNPGCHAWIAQAARENGDRVEVLHLAEALERSFALPDQNGTPRVSRPERNGGTSHTIR